MKAWLMAAELWGIVSGKIQKPSSDDDKIATWETKEAKAAGWIFLLVDDSQKIHIQDCSENCVKMWEALASVHLQKKPGARFNAYDDLFSIRKQEDESLSLLMNRVNDAMRKIKDLHPKDFTLDTLDSELSSMAMIHSLPDDYSSFNWKCIYDRRGICIPIEVSNWSWKSWIWTCIDSNLCSFFWFTVRCLGTTSFPLLNDFIFGRFLGFLEFVALWQCMPHHSTECA